MNTRIQRYLLLALLSISLTSYGAYLPPAQGQQGMVSTPQKLASLVGLKILKEGGNAIDAAVAVGYALAVVQPCCGNIGGGGFMLIHLANQHNVVINFREKAPTKISSQLFFDKKGQLKKNAVHYGYLPVGVPGTVLGLNTALKRYGTMSLQQVMAPAIHYAKAGFVLAPTQIRLLKRYEHYFKKSPNVSAIFLNQGQPYQAGERLIQPQLARTLVAISKQGSQVFYRGWIAKQIVKASQKHGGVLSLKDFANYRVEIAKPIACSYRGYQIITVPPPSSGTIVCEIMNILSGYPLAQFGYHSSASAHYNIEAMRYAFADRNQYLGDPDFVKNPVKKLISKSYAKQIRARIKPNQAGESTGIGPDITHKISMDGQTVHYVVADRYGNAVTITYTLNSYFGSKVIAGNTGFFLNNELDDFTLKIGLPNIFQLVQGRANLIAPNKRPLSSMSPTLVMKNNKLYMALGAAGGSTIITSIVEAMEHVIDYGMNINAGVNSPRYHMQWLPDFVYMEPFTFSPDTLAKLRKMGYRFKLGSVYGTRYWGQVAALLKNNKVHTFYGANDNRYPAGLAIGY